MKKKIISIVVVIALIVTSIVTYNYFGKGKSTVYAEDYREGYVIQPVDIDQTGVKTDSDFIFKWEEEENRLSLKELVTGLSISPDVIVEIRESEEGLLIHPVEELEANTIYVFDYNGITFAYKTEADFALIGTFPRNQTTNVPVNTGIEFIFNYEGADVEDYFEIQPSVKGRFETHGRVVVFVAKELEEATVYTVTLKAGVGLEDSEKVLEEATVFSFETQLTKELNEPKAYINFQSLIGEYKTTVVPEIQWDYYSYDNTAAKSADVKVYAYKEVDSFINDLNSYTFMPYWSWYGMMDSAIDTDGLNEVMDFDYDMTMNQEWPQRLTLPDKLDAGFYLVDVNWEDAHGQTFIQVTDLGFYYSQNTNGDLFWTHDMATGEPLEGVTVTAYEDSDVKIVDQSAKASDSDKLLSSMLLPQTSNGDGVVDLLENRSNDSGITKIYHLQKDNMQSVCFSMNSNFWYSSYYDNQYYWKYFKSDRSLYKPNDTLEFFGYLKGRYEDLAIDEVSVEISQGGFYYWEYLPYDLDSLSYVTEKVSVDNGFFSGSLTLPGLKEGGYELKVKLSGEVVASSYISVEEYVKPSYKMEVTTDKEAVFAEEAIEITVSSQFFEGTPVSYLDFEYNISGIDYMDSREQTDKKGEYVINYTPNYVKGYQGEFGHYFSAYAQLPETGSIWVSDDFRVFLNDIHVDASGKIEDEVGSVEFNVHTITLDRINDGSAEDYQDYLDQPVKGQMLSGNIYRNEWIKTEIGESYDFINKEVRKEYDYHLEKTMFGKMSVETDEEGLAIGSLSLPKEENVYYTGEFKTKDSNNRLMEYNIYFGNGRYYEPNWDDYYRIELDKESYKSGEEIKAEILYGETELKGDFLFMTAQNGILDYTATNSQEIKMEYKESYIPNVDVAGVYYNGNMYIEVGRAMARFDYSDYEIQLEINTDKESYRPGDTIEVKLKASVTDSKGKEIPAKDIVVNIGLIDEALLALSEMTIDPLEDLYRYVSSGMYQQYFSHQNQNRMYFGGYGRGMIMETAEESLEMGSPQTADFAMAKDESASVERTDSSESIRVRSEFKDTAVFTSVQLDESGQGSLTLTLPDNVTSWRLTSAAISKELQAGSQVEDVKVSLPFFLNTAMSSTYLVGDKPMIGVTAYGSDLSGNEAINYVVDVYDSEDKLLSSERNEGLVFERSNLVLGDLTQAGDYKLVIKGLLENGVGDALELPFEVVESYHEQLSTEYFDLVEGFSASSNKSGNTTLTFIDEGRGYYLPTLYRLAYASGKRIDQQYLAMIVKEYLNNNFETDLEVKEVSLNDYMDPSGGIGILPYAEQDVETTVNMLPILRDNMSDLSLAMYLENAWYNKEITEKGSVLYGLIQLGEPVLQDLSYYAQVTNLSDKDKLYISLSYLEIGDTYMAKKFYEETTMDKIESYETRAYVNAGKDYENYELTAMAMLITEKLNLEIHDKYYDYILNTYDKEVLVNTYLYEYILSQMEKVESGQAGLSYEYNGKTVDVDFSYGYARSITLPSQTLDSFKVTKVEGDMKVALTAMTPLKGQIENDSNVTVSRKYYNYQTGTQQNTFKEGDIVKVVLTWEVKDSAIDNYYKLSDYAPAGLKPIDNPWQLGIRGNGRWFRDVDGQKVDFYIFKDTKEHTYEPLVYYARIASIGEYTAEAPIIQGTRIIDSMFIGDTESLTITEN